MPRHGAIGVPSQLPDDPIDPFFNANTPEQLAEAKRLAALYPAI